MGSMVVALGLVLAPSTSMAESQLESIARAGFDLGVLRPLALGQTVVGLGVLPVGLAAGLVTGTTHELIEICWTQPVERTFLRPIGEL